MKKSNFTGIVQKAIYDHSMIEENDKLCIGVSGGKDSLACLHALASIKKYSDIHFELEAVTLDLGLEKTDFSSVSRICEDLGVPYRVIDTHIGKIVLEERKETNPCSLCANLRRGALNNEAVKLGCNKVVLGHNREDAVDTFVLSLLYEGRVHCFSPVTYLSRKDIHVIRPLVYAKESQIIEYCQANGLIPIKSPCPITGTTSREHVRKTLEELSGENPHISDLIFTAIKNSGISGW